MVHKRHLNQTKSWNTDEVNDTPVEPMEVLFDTYYVPIPRKAPVAKVQVKRKRRDTEGININPKRKRYWLYAE